MSGDFRIGDWHVQPAVNRLRRDEVVVRLEPKVMQVLVCLAEANGEVVTREQLIARVWPDVFVTDDVLHRAIRELRRVFGDATASPRYIETIRKRGYRLMVSPAPAAEPRRDRESSSTSVVAPTAVAAGVGWRFPVLAAAVALTVGAAVFLVATRSSELAPEASARFVPVVSGPLNESDPAMSPDGRRVAFVQREAGDASPADIYIRDLADGRVTRLTDNAASDRMPSWSPDGQRIAFVRASRSACDLFIRELRTGVETRVMPCGNVEEPRLAWASDGAAIFTAARPASHAHTGSRIVRIAIDVRTTTPLSAPPAGIIGDDSPAVSPDGGRVAFIRRSSGGVSDVYVMSIGGGDARRVTFDEADLAGVDWSSDGRSLVYASDRAGGYSLWRVPADGGTPVLLAGGAARMKHPVVDRSGRRVVYENWNYEIDVWTVPLGQGAEGARPVTQSSELWNLYPQVSPDGSRVAFVSTQSGAHELWITDRGGGSARQLTHLGQGVVKMPRWSPDGSRIAYLAHAHGAVDVHVIDVDAGVAAALTASPVSETAPSWSHDGARVFFGTPAAGGQWNVWSVSASADDRSPRLEIAAAVAAQASADGEWLYFTRPDEPGLWRAPARNTSSATRVVDRLAPGNALGWVVTARGLWIVDDADAVVRVHLAPLAGGTSAPIAELPQFSWPGFSVTPDGHILYARWERRESNLMSLEY